MLALIVAVCPDAAQIAQAQEKSSGKPAGGAGDAVQIRGTVAAVDKADGTVTLKGPRGRTITIEVRDPQKLEAIKVGDPVVATYVEAVAFRVEKAGTATPGASMQEAKVVSKPGETPAAAVGREVKVTATITGIDKKAQTATLKGPRGNSETIKVKDPKNLEGVKVGDLVEFTYTQALAISLDKPKGGDKAKSDAPKSDKPKN